jgi:hypothetical protein
MKASVVLYGKNRYLVLQIPLHQLSFKSPKTPHPIKSTMIFRGRTMIIAYMITEYVIESIEENHLTFRDHMSVSHELFFPVK